MEGRHSRLLQVVVAAMLLNVAPDGRAETYDIEGVRATVPDDFWDDSAYFDAGYDNWEFDEYTERSVSDGEEPADEPVDEEKKAECDAIAAQVPATCSLDNPPELIRNGCGTGATANIVPDMLVVNGIAVSRFGNLFTSACNRHDTCYGTSGSDKESCDISLGLDMYNKGRDVIPTAQWPYYESHVIVQAGFYSAFLRSKLGRVFSDDAFNAAQAEGLCRELHSSAVTAGCPL